MPRREDDDIDVVAGLSASRDDDADAHARKPALQQASVAPKSTTGKPVQESSDTDRHSKHPPVQKNGSGFKWFVALILLGLIAAAGWLGLQVLELQQSLRDNNNALQLERSRMESISAQVHETGSSFLETGNVLESKFAFFDTEIRKLWDVANKRNKKSIASNATKLKALDASLKRSKQGLQGELKSLSGEQSNMTQAIAKFNKRLASENTALRASLEEQSEQLLLVSGELDILQQRLNRVPRDLSQRIAVNEEAVQAIDASRKQLVGRLMQLQKRVDQLLLQSSTAP